MATEQAAHPTELREQQRRQWDVGAAGWRRWSEAIDRQTGGVSERILELAEIGPGARVLDVGTGYGNPALGAAKVVGAEGCVIATDISAEMLAFARERAAAAGLGNLRFAQAGASSLNFEEADFDAALSRFGIIFEPDTAAAASRVRNFLKPGRRFAISSWAAPERVPFLAIPLGVAVKQLGASPPPPGAPGPLARPTADALSGLLAAADFAEIEVEEAEVTMSWPTPEQYATFVRETVPAVTALVESQPEERQAETWAAITRAAEQRATGSDGGEGAVTLSNVALIAAGRA